MKHHQFVVGALIALLTPLNGGAFEQELHRVAEEIAAAIDNSGAKTVATVDFTDLQGNVTELGRFVAEEISTELVLAKTAFAVIDRTHLKSILAEQNLTISGLLDPRNAKKLGQIAGVDALILGSINPIGETVRLNLKVIDTGTAKILSAARGAVPMTQTIKNMIEQEVQQAAAVTPDAGESRAEESTKAPEAKPSETPTPGATINESEPNDRVSQATPVALNTALAGRIAKPKNRDLFIWKTTESQSGKVRLILRKTFGGTVDVYNSIETKIATATKFEDETISLSFEGSANSVYYFLVKGYYADSGEYELVLRQE